MSGEADFLALFEGPSGDSVQVTIADTTAETALSTPGTVGRYDHFSAVVCVGVVDVEF